MQNCRYAPAHIYTALIRIDTSCSRGPNEVFEHGNSPLNMHIAQQNISNKLCNFGVSFFCVFKLGLEHLVEIKAKCSNFYDTRERIWHSLETIIMMMTHGAAIKEAILKDDTLMKSRHS